MAHRFFRPSSLLLTAVALLVLAQAVPYGRKHTNPAIVQEPQWDSPETRALVKQACLDCHSNETVWPAYSNIAPISWLVSRDVDEGRSVLNFSEWQRPQREARESAKEVREGEMPPWIYGVMHPEARLSDADRDRLARGLDATLGGAKPDPSKPDPSTR